MSLSLLKWSWGGDVTAKAQAIDQHGLILMINEGILN
jgi:hypothetical protein